MRRSFHAVLVDNEGRGHAEASYVVRSDNDFDARRRAQSIFGPKICFDLWDGDRLVLRFRPRGTEPAAHHEPRPGP